MEKNKNIKENYYKKKGNVKKQKEFFDNINPKHEKKTKVTNENYVLPFERKKVLNQFCDRVKIHIKNINLLNQAFIHKSISNEMRGVKNNERLEFLGDSVLGLATADYLYNNFDNSEGDLAKIKSSVVSEKTLAPIALKFGVDKLLILGKGEIVSDGMHKPAILADCMEAIIGAYYLEAGYEQAAKFVISFIGPEIHKACVYGVKDFKTLLQEKYQQYCKSCPKYKIVGKSGPEHSVVYSVTVQLGKKTFGPTRAKTLKEAERLAAKIALDNFDFTK